MKIRLNPKSLLTSPSVAANELTSFFTNFRTILVKAEILTLFRKKEDKI